MRRDAAERQVEPVPASSALVTAEYLVKAVVKPTARRAATNHWPHAAIGKVAPITRLTNLPGHDT